MARTMTQSQTQTTTTLPVQTNPTPAPTVAPVVETPPADFTPVATDVTATPTIETAPLATTAQETMTERQKRVLARADATHDLVVGWSRNLDFKVGPLLTINAGIGALVYFLVNDKAHLLKDHPVTPYLLVPIVLCLLVSLYQCAALISPNLKFRRGNRNGDWASGLLRHQPEEGPISSHIFYGQIARYQSAETFAEAAKQAYADPDTMLDDLLAQIHVNSVRSVEKSRDIAIASGFLLLAVGILLLGVGLYFVGM